MTQQVTAAIVISQATVSPPGGYASGSRDDLIQGQTITLTNLDDTDVIAWSWEITPATGREFADYGVTGSSGATCTLTPPASPDGWGDAHVKLTVTGPKLSTGAINQRTVAVILGIRQPSSDYAAGVPLPSPLESDRGGLVVAQDGKGWRDRVGEALFALQEHAFGGRQSHATAPLWYKLDDASGALVNSGTATSADLTVAPKVQYGIPGPLGASVYVDTASGGGAAGAAGANPGTTAATIWAWVTPILPLGAQWIWGKLRTSVFGIRMGMLADGGLVSGTVNTGSPVTIAASASLPLAGGVPNLVALTYGADLLKLYINGILAAEDAASGSVVWTNESNLPVWALGSSAVGDASPQVIHEAGAYDRALTAAEIAEMYRRGMGWRS